MEAVLLVEDDKDVMAVTSMLLEDAGYEVIQAWNAEQAMRLAEELPHIRVMFTDVNLREGMNGIELARWLKNSGHHASIIVVSGDLAWAETPLDADMRFLAKPYSRQVLLATLAEATADAAH